MNYLITNKPMAPPNVTKEYSCDTQHHYVDIATSEQISNKYWKELRGHSIKYSYFAIYIFHRNKKTISLASLEKGTPRTWIHDSMSFLQFPYNNSTRTRSRTHHVRCPHNPSNTNSTLRSDFVWLHVIRSLSHDRMYLITSLPDAHPQQSPTTHMKT